MEQNPTTPTPPLMLKQPSIFHRFIRHLRSFRAWTKKQAIIALIVLLGLIAGIWFVFFNSSSPVSITSQPVVEAPTTMASPLTGVVVPIKLASRPVTAIMIENSPDARPQSGLTDAGVVFEAIAEGGITRFVALYQEAQPAYVGPVRSVRPYFLDWAAPFNPSVAHVGGSPAALKQVRGSMRDIDQFFNPGAYWRVSNRYAPHNMYTSFAKLDALNKSKGYKSSSFTPWLRKEDKPATAAETTAKTISLGISGYYYDVRYAYDKTTNTYLRTQGGSPHFSVTQKGSQHRIRPKVVIAMVMSFGLASDGRHNRYGNIGKGIVYVFQDGKVTKGTWIKKSSKSQIDFRDAAGAQIALNSGQTWLTAVSSSGAVTYTAK